jgi:hypothetical protein
MWIFIFVNFLRRILPPHTRKSKTSVINLQGWPAYKYILWDSLCGLFYPTEIFIQGDFRVHLHSKQQQQQTKQNHKVKVSKQTPESQTSFSVVVRKQNKVKVIFIYTHTRFK